MTTPSNNSVEIDFDLMEGVLRVTCGPIAFARLRDAVLAELGEDTAIGKDHIQVIGIESIPKDGYRPIMSWVVSIGCLLTCAGVLLVLVFGLITLGRLISLAF
jgi:hypothetical protein